jgi:hypothetical protein
MAKEKLYFGSLDEEICRPLSYFIESVDSVDSAKVQELILFEAVPDTGPEEFVFCQHYGEVADRDQCKKSVCPHYQSKSGRGKCEHRGKFYTHGKEVVVVVKN